MVAIPPPDTRHRCTTPGSYPEGSVWQCPHCLRVWQASEHDGCAPPTYLWRPVPFWRRRRAHRLLRTVRGTAGRTEGP